MTAPGRRGGNVRAPAFARFSRVLAALALSCAGLLVFEGTAVAVPDTWSSGIVVNSVTVATTSVLNFTVTNAGTHNYALWEIQSNMTLASNSCGLCVGNINYSAGQTVNISLNGSPLLSPGFAVYGIVLMEGCGSVAAYYPASMSGLAAGQAVCGGTPSVATNSGSPTPWCSSSSFQSPSGSWVLAAGSTTSGALSVRFGWTLAAPAAGWTVLYPDDGSGASVNMGAGSNVDGSPNTYYGEWDGTTAHTPLTVKISAPAVGGAPGCSVTITLSTNQIAKAPVDTTTGASGDTQTSSNVNCGWSLNPFHYLKCLFEPSHSLQQWNDLKATASARPPVSIMVGGMSYVSSIWNGITGNSSGCGGISTDTTAQCSMVFDPTTGGQTDGQPAANWDLFGGARSAVQTTWGQVFFHVVEVGIWVPALMFMWKRLSMSFGGRE